MKGRTALTPLKALSSFTAMIHLRAFTLVLIFVATLGLAACEEEQPTVVNRRDAKPPTGQGQTGEVCVLVRNRTPFTITGRVQLKTRERTSFRIARNGRNKICLVGTLFGGDTVSLVVTNFMTLPLFSCYVRFDQSIDIYARPHPDGGWLYNAPCS